MKFDPSKANLKTSCNVPGILYALCRDEKQSKLYGAGSDWSVYSVDLKTEKPTAKKCWTSHENYVSALAFLDGFVISVSYDEQIIWTDAESSEQVRSVHAHKGWIRDLSVFPDGTRIASVADDMLVKIWDAETGEQLQELSGHAKQSPQGYATSLYAVAISPDGKHLASGDRVGVVCIWEAETGKLLHQIHAPTFYTYDAITRVRSIGGIRSLRFSPDGSQLAIGGIGKVTNVDGFVGPCRIELWDWRLKKHIQTYQGKHKAVLNDIIFHPTESWIIGGGGGDSGGILAFWEKNKEQYAHKAKPKGHLQKMILDVEQEQLFAVGHDGFQIWSFVEAEAKENTDKTDSKK